MAMPAKRQTLQKGIRQPVPIRVLRRKKTTAQTGAQAPRQKCNGSTFRKRRDRLGMTGRDPKGGT